MLEFHTSAQCPICNSYWLDYKDESFFCEECGKTVSHKSIKFNLADLYELNIPYTANKFDNRLEILREFCDKFNANFLGFDPFEKTKNNHNNYIGMLDIGWADGWPDNLSDAVKELKRILK